MNFIGDGKRILHGNLLDGYLPRAEIDFVGDCLYEDPFDTEWDVEIFDTDHHLRYFRKSTKDRLDQRMFEGSLVDLMSERFNRF